MLIFRILRVFENSFHFAPTKARLGTSRPRLCLDIFVFLFFFPKKSYLMSVTHFQSAFLHDPFLGIWYALLPLLFSWFQVIYWSSNVRVEDRVYNTENEKMYSKLGTLISYPLSVIQYQWGYLPVSLVSNRLSNIFQSLELYGTLNTMPSFQSLLFHLCFWFYGNPTQLSSKIKLESLLRSHCLSHSLDF